MITINPETATHTLTLGQILDHTVARYPDNLAVVYVDRDFRQTWREFSDEVDKIAKGLMALGIQKGEKVGVWASNVPHWVAIQFATAKIGAILLTINTNYKLHEAEFVLKQSDMEILFLLDGFRDTDYLRIVNELFPELMTQPRGNLKSKNFTFVK